MSEPDTTLINWDTPLPQPSVTTHTYTPYIPAPYIGATGQPSSHVNTNTTRKVTFENPKSMDETNRYVGSGGQINEAQGQIPLREMQYTAEYNTRPIMHSTPMADTPPYPTYPPPRSLQTTMGSVPPVSPINNYPEPMGWSSRDNYNPAYTRTERQPEQPLARNDLQSSMAMPGNYNSVQRGTGYGSETYGNYTRSYNMPPPSPSYNRRTNDYADYNSYWGPQSNSGYPNDRGARGSYAYQPQYSNNNWYSGDRYDSNAYAYSDYQVRNKMLEPETFDGTSKTEWSDYIIHFEQIAEWNNWSASQKARMLTIKLRGEAQKFIGGLTHAQFSDFDTLKNLLTQRFNPQEREVAFRCEFRSRRRNKGESPSDFGYALRRLAQKAFPATPYTALEVQIIDQFILGLGSVELQKHVQFHHPPSLEAAINLAIEYTAVVGNLDKVTKPNLTESDTREITSLVNQLGITNSVASLRPMEFKPSFSLQDLEQRVEQIVTGVVDKLLSKTPDSRSRSRDRSVENLPQLRSKSPYRRRDQSPRNRDPHENETRRIKCDYCKRTGHVESRCWFKQDDEAKRSAQPLNA